MAKDIIVQPHEVWHFFMANKDVIEECPELLASNDETGVDIYITAEDDLPYIYVNDEDNQLCEEAITDEEDCNAIMEYIYEEFLGDDPISVYDDIIAEREDELSTAVDDFLRVALLDLPVTTAIVEACKESLLEKLAEEYAAHIYRPMWLEDDDGNEEFFEYPYTKLA